MPGAYTRRPSSHYPTLGSRPSEIMNYRIAQALLPVVLAGASVLSGCVAVPAPIDTAYRGSDAGKVVLSLSASPDAYFYSYTLQIHQAGLPDARQAGQGGFTYKPGSPLFPARTDFGSDDEKGQVLSATLPAGHYEISGYRVVVTNGSIERALTPEQPFAIPFTVQPKQTTYLGSYYANQLTERSAIGLQVPAGVVFKVDSARERDLEVVRKRQETVRDPVADATPDVVRLNHPAFVGRDRSKE